MALYPYVDCCGVIFGTVLTAVGMQTGVIFGTVLTAVGMQTGVIFGIVLTAVGMQTGVIFGTVWTAVGMQTEVIFGDQPYGLPLTEKLMPQYLKPLGYRSHIVGKVSTAHQ